MSNKTILITGAVGNLGTSVCENLINQGHQVIGTIRPGSKSPESKVDFYVCDLTSEASTEKLFAKLQSKYSKIDVVICLVGGFGMANIQSATSSDMMKMLQLNYMTAFHTASQATRWMNQTGGGRLIFVGAKPAMEGGASAVLPYAVSKSAVIKLAETINEDAELKNIQAGVIVPSIIDTPINRESMPDANFYEWVKPEEIAENIAFLISETASIVRNPVLKLYNNA